VFKNGCDEGVNELSGVNQHRGMRGSLYKKEQSDVSDRVAQAKRIGNLQMIQLRALQRVERGECPCVCKMCCCKIWTSGLDIHPEEAR